MICIKPIGDTPNDLAKVKALYYRFFPKTPIKYEWRHKHYGIFSFGGQINEAEYHQFWKD